MASLVFVFMQACSQGGQPRAEAPPLAAPVGPFVYAAVGASETLGAGTRNPRREAWPQLFYRQSLPVSATFYDFGIPSESTAAAIDQELPEALSVRPDLVTVWLNVDDIIGGVPSDQYERSLDRLVAALRQDGHADVLVANTPSLDRLPAYRLCLESSTACPLPGHKLPPPADLESIVAAYNAAIARVVVKEGAVLVDLAAGGDVADAHPDWIGSDGFHPSAAGHVVIAAAFSAAFAGRTPQSGIRDRPNPL